MDAIHTAYYDLKGMASIINLKDNKKFSAVPVYPLVRDVCLMVYQINKDLLDNSIDLDPNIKKIRHRVKLYQKKDNFKVYNRIINLHIHQFGNDVDNLGFYLDEDQLIGSTLYPTYIFQDTQFFTTNPTKTAENAYVFTESLGETIGIIINKLIEKSNNTLPPFEIPIFKYKDEIAYVEKDILSRNIFSENQNYNVFLTRLLISLQEASSSVWLYNGISQTSNSQLDNYILLRLLSIKADEIMDNLKNMQTFLPDVFGQVDKSVQFKISSLINDFDNDLNDECRTLRNMIHYNENDINFMKYVKDKINIENDYIEIVTHKIVKYYMEPFCIVVSDYINLNKKNSMNNFVKIIKRLLSLIKGEDFRKFE